jgi:hypothetical protein
MDIEFKLMKLTCVGLGVAGTAVPEVMVVGCPEVPRQTYSPASRPEQSDPRAGFQVYKSVRAMLASRAIS